MTAKNLKEVLHKANKNKYAVAGLVVLGWEDALAYTEAADETGIPIILQAGPSCRKYMPVPILGKMLILGLRGIKCQKLGFFDIFSDTGY